MGTIVIGLIRELSQVAQPFMYGWERRMTVDRKPAVHLPLSGTCEDVRVYLMMDT